MLKCRLFHIPAGDESDWEAWARSPFSTDPGGRASSDRVNTNLSAPSGLGTSELLLPRPVVAVGAVVGVVGVVVDERGHVDDDEAERVPQRRDDAQRAARLLAAERERVQLLEAQRRRELVAIAASRRYAQWLAFWVYCAGTQYTFASPTG